MRLHARRSDTTEFDPIREPRIGDLPRDFDLVVAYEQARPEPRHAQSGGENHDDRETEEQLTLVGKTDAGNHG